jgi:hypothetical protein
MDHRSFDPPEVLQSTTRRTVAVDLVLACRLRTLPPCCGARSRRLASLDIVGQARNCLTLLITYSSAAGRMTVFAFLTVSFALGLPYLFLKLTVGAAMGFSALIVTITFSSGLILLSLGMIGEYISRIHTMGSGEPAFIVKAVV